MPLLLSLLLALTAIGAVCGGDSNHPGAITDVTIVPLGSPTQQAEFAITSKGGQPSHTPTAIATAIPTTEEAPPAATEPPPTVAAPSAISTPVLQAESPTSGRWIDVDVTNFVVRLMDGKTAVREIAPVGVGVAIDTGAYISTQTGLFYVHTKAEALVYDAPFDTYISHWVGFDAAKDNGFHSFLKDADGNVVDASTGRVSNGCIRTGEPDAVFAYAELGMAVFVHW